MEVALDPPPLRLGRSHQPRARGLQLPQPCEQFGTKDELAPSEAPTERAPLAAAPARPPAKARRRRTGLAALALLAATGFAAAWLALGAGESTPSPGPAGRDVPSGSSSKSVDQTVSTGLGPSAPTGPASSTATEAGTTGTTSATTTAATTSSGSTTTEAGTTTETGTTRAAAGTVTASQPSP